MTFSDLDVILTSHEAQNGFSYEVGYSSVIVVSHSVTPSLCHSVHPSIQIFVTATEQKVFEQTNKEKKMVFSLASLPKQNRW